MLLLIVLGALALRVGYVMVAKRNEPVLGDQIYYVAQANTLARGDGFTDPRDGSQTAEHPPLTALALTPDVVGGGAASTRAATTSSRIASR